MIYTDSNACASRQHCTDCRASREFRRSIAEHWEVPGGVIDFACPIGLPIIGETTDEPAPPPPPPRPSPQPRPSTGDPFTPEVAHARAVEAQAVALPSAWERITHGGFALAKIALGVDRSTDALIAERKAICEACPFLQGSRCMKCACGYANKVKLASEACPDAPPRW